MLEKPDFQDEKIIACLQTEFGVDVAQITFLPLGADQNTAVYRVVADDATLYFLKLRSGVFDNLWIQPAAGDAGGAHGAAYAA